MRKFMLLVIAAILGVTFAAQAQMDVQQQLPADPAVRKGVLFGLLHQCLVLRWLGTLIALESALVDKGILVFNLLFVVLLHSNSLCISRKIAREITKINDYFLIYVYFLHFLHIAPLAPHFLPRRIHPFSTAAHIVLPHLAGTKKSSPPCGEELPTQLFFLFFVCYPID